VLRGNVITENQVGVLCQHGSTPEIGGALEFHNDIVDNADYAVENRDETVTVDARFNYWGDSTGPHDPSEGPPLHNPGGQGGAVTDHVDYSSWASAAEHSGWTPRGPDLSVTLRGDGTVVPGMLVSYQVWCRNLSDTEAPEVALQLDLPPGITYREDNSGFTPEVSGDSRTITWAPGTIAPRQDAVFLVLADSEEGLLDTVTTSLQVSTTAEEPNLANNSASWESPAAEPEPRMMLCIFGDRLRPGFTSNYTVFYTNAGTAPAYDVRIVVQLDSSTFDDGVRRGELISASVTDGDASWEYDQDANTITYYLGDVHPAFPEDAELPGDGGGAAGVGFRVPRSAYGEIIKETAKWAYGVHRRNQPCASMEHVVGCFQRSESASSALEEAGVPWEVPGHVVGSQDPNDKQVTPAGYGEGIGYFRGDRPLFYTIRFENKPEATAEATYVTIEDVLDPDLDWLTVQIVGVQVGGVLHSPYDYDRGDLSVSLDPHTGLLRVFFDDINLPPNTAPPQGEGMVVFAVSPRPGLPDGTEIRNKASIVFDYNAPIETPETVNTIDSTAPQSRVLPLPATLQSESFEVAWEGSDAFSGVRHCTIFVSDNGGEFTPWITDTRETSAVFTGEPGHTYAFYSTASDNAWNREPRPDVPDAKVLLEATGVGPFLRGDCSGDGEVVGGVTDAVVLLSYNFTGGSEPPCLAACDANGDGEVVGGVTDAIYTLTFNFLGGPAPVDPFPDCGPGTLASDESLGCELPLESCDPQ
jgi:hypothetical protein